MGHSDSLLQDLLQLQPDLKVQTYFKATLTAISHAMEDLILSGTDQPLVIANFQQERFYRQEAMRYQRIAQFTDQIYVLAFPETGFDAVQAPFPTIGLEQADELTQEWHLVIIGQKYSACLVCREHAAPVGAIALDSARQFRGFWTFDPEVSRRAATFLLRRIGYYRPDLNAQIQKAKQRYQLNVGLDSPQTKSSVLELDAQLFVDRLVTYLQANQYRQVKAYRRILGQERQERLVNRLAATIRQFLEPSDVLSIALQEVVQLFGQCRCLLYRLPVEDSGSISTRSSIEYEATPPPLTSLLGKNWRLATHIHFQAILGQGNLVTIVDTHQDSGLQAHPDLQAQLEQAQIRACLLVPICYQQQCLAILEVHDAQPHLWTVGDRDLLAAIATQVGLALIQAEAYIRLQQANQQLVSIKRAQNNLIAIVGHELRTPLSTIQVCLESLEAEPEMPLKFQRPMVETALMDSARLRRLIQDFLLLSRLESNLTNWQVEPIDLADSIAMTIKHLQIASQPQDLPTIVVDIPSTLPLIMADGEALFQLLSKLLDNARKFTPSTGTITFSARSMHMPEVLGETRTNSVLEIQIADTGRGIEPNQLENIFERFHQEEGFLQRAAGGTGLGLAICNQLVKQLGGQIWAMSGGKGQGSRFYIHLPVLVND